MAKITHYELEDGTIIRETKEGNKITREEITQEEFDRYEIGSGLFGCVGMIIGLIVMLMFMGYIAV